MIDQQLREVCLIKLKGVNSFDEEKEKKQAEEEQQTLS